MPMQDTIGKIPLRLFKILFVMCGDVECVAYPRRLVSSIYPDAGMS
jgi:hypothetical protein